MGGEANFLFAYASKSPWKLERVEPKDWQLPEMRSWTEGRVTALLDTAESALRECIDNLNMPVNILRKERAVGIIPRENGLKLSREQLEETVLMTQRVLEMSEAGKNIPFCAFNGGNDVRWILHPRRHSVPLLTCPIADLCRYRRQVLGCQSLPAILRRH